MCCVDKEDLYKNELEQLKKRLRDLEEHDQEAAHALNIKDHYLDPHINVLVQATAFLCASLKEEIQNNKNEQFAKVLSILAEFFTQFIPSTALVQLRHTSGENKEVDVKAHTQLHVTQENEIYKFRTTRQITVVNSKTRAFILSPIDFGLNIPETNVMGVEVDPFVPQLSFFTLNNELAEQLYLNKRCIVLCSKCESMYEGTMEPVEFDIENPILPAIGLEGDGIRMLLEFFIQPKLMNFFHLKQEKPCLCERCKKIVVFTFQAERTEEDVFTTNCVPVINLFLKRSDPFAIEKKFRILLDFKSNIKEKIVRVISFFKINKLTGEEEKIPEYRTNFDGGPSWVAQEDQIEIVGFDVEKWKEAFGFCEMLCVNKRIDAFDNATFKIIGDNVRSLTFDFISHLTKPNGFRYPDLALKVLMANFRGDLTPEKIIKLFDLVMRRCNAHKINDHHFIKNVTKVRVVKRVVIDSLFCSNIVGQEVRVVFSNSYASRPSYIFFFLLSRVIQSYSPLNSFTDVVIILENGDQLYKNEFVFN